MLFIMSSTMICAGLYTMSHDMMYQIYSLSCSVSTFGRSVVFHIIVAFSCVLILSELCGFVACTLSKISKNYKTSKTSKTAKFSKTSNSSKTSKITKHEIAALAADKYGKIDSLRGLGACITSQKHKLQ